MPYVIIFPWTLYMFGRIFILIFPPDRLLHSDLSLRRPLYSPHPWSHGGGSREGDRLLHHAQRHQASGNWGEFLMKTLKNTSFKAAIVQSAPRCYHFISIFELRHNTSKSQLVTNKGMFCCLPCVKW